LPAARRDAYEELVGYPVRGTALANQRYFLGESGETARAFAANADLRETTRCFNEELAGGKWRGFLNLEPADAQWKGFRIAPWEPKAFAPKPATTASTTITLEAGHFIAAKDRGNTGWKSIPGLGVAPFPTTAPGVDEAKLATNAPRLDYAVDFPAAGEFTLTTYLLPTHPLVAGRGLRFALGLDDAPPQLVVCDVKDGSPAWAQGVLNNYVTVETKLTVPAAGRHTVQIYGVDAGVVLQKLVIRQP
jgi:hypothetical protein